MFQIELQKSIAAQEMSDDHLVDMSMSTGISNSQQILTTPSSSIQTINNLEWTLIATAVDRLVFVIFSFVFTIMSICFVRAKRFKFSSDNIPFWHHWFHLNLFWLLKKLFRNIWATKKKIDTKYFSHCIVHKK